MRATARGDVDAAVVKLDLASSAILYATFLGGSHWDGVFAIAVDTLGNAYVRGSTQSPDFPTSPGAFQESYGGGPADQFLAKLDAGGSIVFSTLLGGGGDEYGAGIAVDGSGNVYAAGSTTSRDFPTANPLQSAPRDTLDAFVVKLSADGSELIFSTYLGGSGPDEGSSIAVDRAGHAYVTGSTSSSDFPLKSPLQPKLAGAQDAFVAKLEPDGADLVYSTYLGGGGSDEGSSVAVDPGGSAWVAGETQSLDFPAVHAAQSAPGGARDLFVTRLDPAGSKLLHSTYLGGSAHEGGGAMALDPLGNALVAGGTGSSDFPLVNPVQSAFGGGSLDVVLAKLDSTGALLYASFLGGSGLEGGEGVAAAPNGDAYVTGLTLSIDLPTVEPLQPTAAGDLDVFLARVEDAGSGALPPLTPSGRGDTVQVAVAGSVTDLGTLGGEYSLARGLNDRGWVVGESETASGERHAFLWMPEEGMSDLGTLGGAYSSGWSVSADGRVVGQSRNAAGEIRPFRWEAGEGMRELGPAFGGFSNGATAVNAGGQVAGWREEESFERHASLWTEPGGHRPLGVLGSAALGLPVRDISLPGTRRVGSSRAWAINVQGQVAGESETSAGGAHAFVWTAEAGMRDLRTLGGPISRALAINDLGDVVGESMTAAGEKHAFLWTEEAGMTDLGTLGGKESVALGINRRGHVVGYSLNTAGARRAFLWTAVMGMIDLGTLGGTESIARGINGRGQVIGESLTAAGTRRAVLWTVSAGSGAAENRAPPETRPAEIH